MDSKNYFGTINAEVRHRRLSGKSPYTTGIAITILDEIENFDALNPLVNLLLLRVFNRIEIADQ